MVTNKYKNIFSLTFTLCACAECIGLTKPTMQQCFHTSAKHLLYRYITPSFVGHSFRVEGETYFFANLPLCIYI